MTCILLTIKHLSASQYLLMGTTTRYCLIVCTIVEVILILFLYHFAGARQRKIKKENLTGIRLIASIDVIKNILRLCGSYFFAVRDNSVVITNTDDHEAEVIAKNLKNKEIDSFLSNSLEGTHSKEIRLALTGTEKHWYQIRYNVTVSNNGRIKKEGVIIPIDKIKQEESAMIEMHRRTLNAQGRDNFVHEMNHMIRTPLNVIVGFSDILSDPDYEVSQEEAEEYKVSIEENATRLLNIIENALTISHIDSENVFLDNRKITVSRLMETVLEENSHLLEKGGIQTIKEQGDEQTVVSVDARVMEIVLQHIISNVVEHASSGKVLLYGWTENENGVELYIKDRGNGIKEVDLPFIFNAFYKADPFSSGAGLGLAVAKEYLDKENATIRCESSENKGASFIISFLKRTFILMMALIMVSCKGQGGISVDTGDVLLVCIQIPILISLAILAFRLFKFSRIDIRYQKQQEEQADIARTLRAIGGHLFKIVNNRIVITEDSARYFNFSKNQISLDSTLDSMDETNQQMFLEVFNSSPGEISEAMISVPNFNTFKIMSFSAIVTKTTDDEGNAIPMGIFYSVDEEQTYLEKMRESFLKEEESKAKQSFLARASHEIRTPLNAIVGFSSLLVENHDSISLEEKQEYADIIKQQNEQLLSILDSTMMSPEEQDKILQNSLKTTKISDLMEELFHTHQVIIPPHLTFKFETGEEAYAKISRTSIRQVVSNLINNACKFTESGTITLGWNSDKENVYIYVSDTGCGIPKEDLNNIFKQFFKIDSTTTGAGIGLPLSKRLVEVMGGELLVESQLGYGSEFIIKLPLSQETAEQ